MKYLSLNINLSETNGITVLICVFVNVWIDVQFGTPNQKFGLSGIGFEGQQGMGGSPGLMNNEMVKYPLYGKIGS